MTRAGRLTPSIPILAGRSGVDEGRWVPRAAARPAGRMFWFLVGMLLGLLLGWGLV